MIRKRLALSLEEAEKQGIKWKYWHDPSVEEGDWIKSDDDIVLYVKKRWDLRNSRGYPSTAIRTIVKVIFQEHYKEFKCKQLLKDRTNVGNSKAGFRDIHGKLSEREKLVIRGIASGEDPMRVFERVYPNRKTAKQWALRKILQKEKAIQFMSELVKEKLTNAGLTETWWFERIKAMSEGNTRDDVKWDILKVIGQIHEIIEPTKKLTMTERKTLYLDGNAIDRLEKSDETEITE